VSAKASGAPHNVGRVGRGSDCETGGAVFFPPGTSLPSWQPIGFWRGTIDIAFMTTTVWAEVWNWLEGPERMAKILNAWLEMHRVGLPITLFGTRTSAPLVHHHNSVAYDASAASFCFCTLTPTHRLLTSYRDDGHLHMTIFPSADLDFEVRGS
jgi:hypothetical protein